MAIRLAGLVSGMDTDTIIKQMMDAQRLKYKKTEDKLTLLDWKQERWKDLNAKLYKLYQEDISKMRLQTSYLTKKVTSSNEDLATVVGKTNAPEGSHSLIIDKLASSQYITGAVLEDDINTSSLLKEALGMTSSDGKDSIITITHGNKKKELIVTDKTTLGDFINTCKDAGLNAGYDTTQKRLFVSSKNSGLDNKFTITTGEISSDAAKSLKDIKSLVDYSKLTRTEQKKFNEAMKRLKGKSSEEINALYEKIENNEKGENSEEQKAIDALKSLVNFANEKVESDTKAAATKEVRDGIIESLYHANEGKVRTLEQEKQIILGEMDEGILPSDTDVDALAQQRYDENIKNAAVRGDLTEQITKKIESGELTVPEDKTAEEFIAEEVDKVYDTATQSDRNKMFDNLVNKTLASEEYQNRIDTIYDSNIDGNKQAALEDLVTKVGVYSSTEADNVNTANNLAKLGLGEITEEIAEGGSSPEDSTTGMTVIAAANAEITLDGAKLTGSSNEFSVNGMTLTLKGKTEGETITLSVTNNTEEISDMVKEFVKNYNTILKEMNELYDAPSSRGYDPLSDDEMEAMTDSQIEKWETKIKDSILRRDSILGSLTSAMRTSLQGSVEIDGKRYSLATFGIQTSSDYKEKGLLHIFGDKEDPTYSDKEDKLMKALEEDPDTVMKVLTEITGNLYKEMSDKMSAIPNFRSSFKFYNDKEMNRLQTDYKKKIAQNEKKLTALEDKYYRQFSAMETAMARLQKQQSALAGLLGQQQQ